MTEVAPATNDSAAAAVATGTAAGSSRPDKTADMVQHICDTGTWLGATSAARFAAVTFGSPPPATSGEGSTPESYTAVRKKVCSMLLSYLMQASGDGSQDTGVQSAYTFVHKLASCK